MIVVVAEKPSVASSIAQVLQARDRKEGYFEGNGYQVSWAVGHLVEIAPPEVLNPAWKSWTLEQLPLVPREWTFEPRKDVAAQFKTLKKLMCARKVKGVVCATDAGREGEHIFRLIYRLAGCDAPVRRLWISSLTEDAIRKGFDNLRPGADFDGLAAAAEGRDKADWIVGLTLTRLYTLVERGRVPKNASVAGHSCKGAAGGEVWSVGRVQTPTLALVVARDLARKQFARTPYRLVRATFSVQDAEASGLYHREVRNPETGELELSAELPSSQSAKVITPLDDADAIVSRAGEAGFGVVRAVRRKTEKEAPPLLYDLSALQQDANRLWGWKASHTLTVAQRLYQELKVLSYPRTASRHLDEDTAKTVPQIFRAVAGPYADKLPPTAGSAVSGRRFVDNGKVGDHHALIPTSRAPTAQMTAEDRDLYDLVVRRFLQMWCDSLVTEQVRAEVITRSGHFEDLFVLKATNVVIPGWTVLEVRARERTGEEDERQSLPPAFGEGVRVAVRKIEALARTKNPPPAYTEATLLKAMETAGKRVEDPALETIMRERGLGTPATRAAILEGLVARGYLERDARSLRATEKGIGLIARVHRDVRTPEITGRWEQRLELVAKGEESLVSFLKDVEKYVTEVVNLERDRAPVNTGR